MSFDVLKEFGVPDEIGDMTRSLEMVETQRLIYWTMLFGHRMSSERYRIIIGVPEGYRNPLGELMGLDGT